jgi:tRNA G10  N-methylase Trm11
MVICVLGRQPEIGIAELESLYGSDNVRLAGNQCALVDADVDFDRLGGSVKIAKLLETTSDTSRKSIFKTIAKLLPTIVASLPTEGKVKLGLSVYGFNISPYDLGGEALRLKKVVRSLNRSIRVVPNESPALSSAQTYHNRLADELGVEFVIVNAEDKVHIGRVTAVQDIDSYRVRDRDRPKRDAFVGMLPPKLAQTIINLAVGGREIAASFSEDSAFPAERGDTKSQMEPSASEEKDGGDLTNRVNTVILDPFCGTGVILQEALIMGYDAYGTDLSKKMIDYSSANLEWLEKSKFATVTDHVRLEEADATDHIWRQPISAVATETYLGQPLGGQSPSKEKFAEIVHETNAVVRGFLQNLSSQLSDGTRLCVAVPVWFLGAEPTHLPVIDELASMGLIRHTFSHAVAPLMYHREDQITGRELLVLTKEHHDKAQLISSP